LFLSSIEISIDEKSQQSISPKIFLYSPGYTSFNAIIEIVKTILGKPDKKKTQTLSLRPEYFI